MPGILILKHIATPAPWAFAQKKIENTGFMFMIRHSNIVCLMKRYRFHMFIFL